MSNIFQGPLGNIFYLLSSNLICCSRRVNKLSENATCPWLQAWDCPRSQPCDRARNQSKVSNPATQWASHHFPPKWVDCCLPFLAGAWHQPTIEPALLVTAVLCWGWPGWSLMDNTTHYCSLRLTIYYTTIQQSKLFIAQAWTWTPKPSLSSIYCPLLKYDIGAAWQNIW